MLIHRHNYGLRRVKTTLIPSTTLPPQHTHKMCGVMSPATSKIAIKLVESESGMCLLIAVQSLLLALTLFALPSILPSIHFATTTLSWKCWFMYILFVITAVSLIPVPWCGFTHKDTYKSMALEKRVNQAGQTSTHTASEAGQTSNQSNPEAEQASIQTALKPKPVLRKLTKPVKQYFKLPQKLTKLAKPVIKAIC